eukprot:SAG11_NODE_15035_length_591_cov_0.918699_1_plen_122_part_01
MVGSAVGSGLVLFGNARRLLPCREGRGIPLPPELLFLLSSTFIAAAAAAGTDSNIDSDFDAAAAVAAAAAAAAAAALAALAASFCSFLTRSRSHSLPSGCQKSVWIYSTGTGTGVGLGFQKR